MKNRKRYTEETDVLLFARMQTDDNDAFAVLFNRYHPMIYSVALFYLKDSDQAEDIVQQIFLRLWEQRHSLHLHSSFKNYLFTMAKNGVLNQIRNDRTTFEKNYELAQEAPLEEEFELVMETRERRELLFEAINRLTPAQRKVITFRLNEELNHQEVALRMNLSVNTVKSHYQAALKALRKRLDHALFTLFVLIVLIKV